MRIVTIRTDKPEAEIGIFDDSQQLVYKTWLAHRELAESLHQVLADVLAEQQMTLEQIEGLVVYEGPGSFTGLRIGITVANALAYSFSVPIIGARGDDWKGTGIARLVNGDNDTAVLPFYGAEANITTPRK